MSRDVHRRLCAAVLRKTAPAHLIASHERPWASVTFSGARHWMTVIVPQDAAARLVAELPEAEFDLPGQLVADVAVTSQCVVAQGIELGIEALTVEAC